MSDRCEGTCPCGRACTRGWHGDEPCSCQWNQAKPKPCAAEAVRGRMLVTDVAVRGEDRLFVIDEGVGKLSTDFATLAHAQAALNTYRRRNMRLAILVETHWPDDDGPVTR